MAKDKTDNRNEPQAPAEPRERRQTVRAWTEHLKSRRALVAGAAKLAGWTPEAELSEAEFTRGLDAYAQRPLGGPARKSPSKARLTPGGSR